MAETGSRLPSAKRRQQLIEAGIEIAREEGGNAVSLARVADRAGVSKPIAYRHFGTLTGLLGEMHREVVAGYERAVAEAVTASRDETGGAVAVIAAAYVDHSLGLGGVFKAITAARTAAEGMGGETFAPPETYVELAMQGVGLSREAAVPLIVMFLGAADNLVAAVQAGVLTRDAAVVHLVDLFSVAVAVPQ